MFRIRQNATSIVVCIVGCALLVLIQRTLPSPVGSILISLIFLGTVLVAGILGGWKSGVAATALLLFSALVFFSPPFFIRAAAKPVELLRLLPFVFLGTALSAICEMLQRAWRRIAERQRQLEEEVNERRRAQMAEQARADELMTTLASIGDGVIRTDSEGRVTFLNPVAEELVGWKTEDAAGRMLLEVFHIVNEETRQTVENPAMRALKEGIIVGLANHTILIAKDGTERPIDDSAAPIRSKEGEILGCVLVFRDISGRKRAEADKQKIVSLVEISTDFISLCDLEAMPFYVNSAGLKMVGLDGLDQAIRPPIREFFFPEDQHHIMNEFLPSVMAEGHGETEVRLRHFKTGNALWVLFRVFILFDSQGKHSGMATVSRDITQRRELEDNLRRLAADLSDANHRKDEFLATLAHELRNPLAPIRNGLQLLRSADGDRTTVDQIHNMMERQLTQLVRLVDDLMDISRISRGKIELRTEKVELVSALNNALETSRPLIEEMRHELTVTLPNESILVEADMTRLAQIFLNLLNNAAKYSDRGSHIWLTAERHGTDVVINVKDNGIGIAPDQLLRVFEMFSQVDRSLEKSQGGLGIGLSLVKRLVEMHGGRIEAKSEGTGKGSEFIVSLPTLIELTTPQVPTGEDNIAFKSELRILIVDDNRDGADTLSMMLRGMGNHTRTAYDGAEAVVVTQEFQPDVVLLDIGLPKLNGYEACRRIREQAGGNELIIVAQTGWGAAEDRKRSRDAGFDHHLVKPVDPQALMKLLMALTLPIASENNGPKLSR